MPVVAHADSLDDKIAAFGEAQTQTAAAVEAILKTGLAAGRSAEAYAAMKAWLLANPSDSQALLFHAARAAQHAGEWPDAAGFYRRLLQQTTINAPLAADVVPAFYRLMINDLRDEQAAYLFMREEGHRLRQFGRAKQFDPWFLDKAFERGDLTAVAERLAAIYARDGEYAAFVDRNLNRLLGEAETFNHGGEALFEALKKLAAASKTTRQTRARLDWVMAIVPVIPKMEGLIKAKPEERDTVLAAPLKAAQDLIAAVPNEGSRLAARAWMHFGHGHTPYFQQFVDVKREAKAAPILKALPTLTPDQGRAVLGLSVSAGRGRRVGQHLFSAAELRGLVGNMPAVFNSLDAPDVPLWDSEMTLEEAKAIAPHLARNPHAQAALIRAYAAVGEKKFEPVLAAMANAESWRFAGDGRVSAARRMVDTVWNAGVDREGVDHGETVKQYEQQFNTRIGQLNQQVDKEAASNSRMAAFNKLYQELRGTPSTPTLRALWQTLLTQAPHADKQQILQTLVADVVAAPPAASDLQTTLLRQALAIIDFGNPYSKLTFGPEFAGGWDRWGHQNVRNHAPELAVYLEGLLKQQMAAGTLDAPVFSMWLHCVHPKAERAVAFFEELVISPAYATLDSAYQRMAAHGLLFGALAWTDTSAPVLRVVSRELLDLPGDAPPAQVEIALKAVMRRVAEAPDVTSVIGLHEVAALPAFTGDTRRLMLALFGELSPLDGYPSGQGYEALGVRLVRSMQEAGDWGEIEPYAAAFWRSARSSDHPHRYPVADALTVFAEQALAAGHASVAMSVVRCGRQTPMAALDPNNGHDNTPRRVARLQVVASQAADAIGAIEIPVAATHPDYGLFKSNAEHAQGNLDSAWELYTQHASRLHGDPEAPDAPSLLRKMTLGYAFWLLERNLEAGRQDDAEFLIRELMIWSRQTEGLFSAQQTGLLNVLHADLAFLRGALPTARAWYRRVAEAREHRDSELHVRAALGSVRIDRISKNFGAALDELDTLMRIRLPGVRAGVHFARAEVLMDQETYREALDEVDIVLRENPNHADALILRGQIQYQMRKLVEASEIQLGVTQAQQIIVPGESLKINLLDPTLSIAGVSVDIEVEVTTRSGDRERLMLYPFGDNRDTFRAEMPTVLGPATPGDGTLQVLGDDEIRYGFSERFRARMRELPPDPDVVITVASDARLSLSAGAFPPREGERRINIDELGLSTAQRALGVRAVRPGNPVYLRVTDPDQSRTAGIDEVFVSLRTSSGDEIRRLSLKETAPFSGEFEGVVPTATAQAMAFASEVAPGRDPNMAISAKAYPGWLGQVGATERERLFSVDLNDSVSLDRMTFQWLGADQAITHFVLQTSLNGRDWITRARYPEDIAPWDGRPRVTSFPTYRGGIAVSNPTGRGLPADWREKMERLSARASCGYLAAHVPALSVESLPMVDTGHPQYSGLMRYQALFHQPVVAVRRFQLTGYPPQNTIFLIDGQPAGPESDDPLVIEREFAPGLHEIEVWRHEGRDTLLARRPVIEVDGQLAPDSLFDPTTFPAGLQARIPQPASIASVTGGIEVAFGTNTQARLVRLAIQGFDGLAPGIKQVAMTGRDGKSYLPVEQDFMALRDNLQLEVLPGDTITARYRDPVTATPGRDRHEQRLQVAFHDGRISASFAAFEMLPTGERRLKLEPIRRFRHGDPVLVVIDDVDMDSSPERDQVEFTIATSDGLSVTQRAVESEPHSGRFVGRIFPVKGEPERDSEIRISEGATITASFRDVENLNPGVPVDRTVTLQHAQYVEPSLGLYTMDSEPIPASESDESAGKAVQGGGRGRGASRRAVVQPRQAVRYRHVKSGAAVADGPLEVMIGCSLRFDVVAPHLALAQSSEINAYVQVSSNGQVSADEPFDITVPGTLKLQAAPGRAGASVAPGYALQAPPAPPSQQLPLDEGRFSFSVPLLLGPRPARSFATRDAEQLSPSAFPEGLAVSAGDVVRIGYAWQGPDGKVRWKTASLQVVSHAFLDVLNDTSLEPLQSAFVGERILVRLQAYGLSGDRNGAAVELQADSGATATLALRESEPHSGLFNGVFELRYADPDAPTSLPPVDRGGFPVRYGDTVRIRYGEQERIVSVNTGADGMVEPFSKRFTGDEMAVRTSFTMAECFFELAKMHRKMDQESLARRQMAHAQKLLSEAIATHTDDDLRANAEYLLGNLAQEYADLSQNDEARLPMYQEALARFTKIPVHYPETEFAPKAQFKIALVYERMGEMEIAVEEYVKLAYKHPGSEHIPEVMSRLGGYYQQKGQQYKEQADPLREKTDLSSQAEVLRLDELSYPEYLRAARIFRRLQERFPDHSLAGLAGLRSAQNYMRAHQYHDAIEGFQRVYNTETYDGRDIRAQAMYWSGLSHERRAAALLPDDWRGQGGATAAAYDIYRRVTLDFPDSRWAKFARGRLADPVFARTIEQDREARRRLLEGIQMRQRNRR